MYVYVELWSAKEAWVKLPPAERKEKLEELIAEAQKNPITGVLPVSVRQVGDVVLYDGVKETPAVIDKRVARPTGFHYMAAYMIPTVELIHKFEDRVESLGWWFDYFEQQNAWGLMDIEGTVKDMIETEETGPTEPSEEPPAPPKGEKKTLMGRLSANEEAIDEMRKDIKTILKHLKINQRT